MLLIPANPNKKKQNSYSLELKSFIGFQKHDKRFSNEATVQKYYIISPRHNFWEKELHDIDAQWFILTGVSYNTDKHQFPFMSFAPGDFVSKVTLGRAQTLVLKKP